MKEKVILTLLGSIFILVACGRQVDLSISLDNDFVERLEAYFGGTDSASSLFLDGSPSWPALSSLEWIKKTLPKVKLTEPYILTGDNYHLADFATSLDSTLYFFGGEFYEDSDQIDGFVMLSSDDGGVFSIGFFRNESGRLYIPDFTKIKLPNHGKSPPETYLQYSFKGLGDDILASPGESLIAEIQLKNSVFGVSYGSRHGIFYNSGIIPLPAGGEVHEAKITYFTDCDGVSIEILSGKGREKVNEAQSNKSVHKEDSDTFKLKTDSELNDVLR
jgi:hypothetical protein